MHDINGGTFSPTSKIPYQNNRYFCEILILSLKNQQEYATTNAPHPQNPPPFCASVFLIVNGQFHKITSAT
jgi:hypothetical protein